MADRAVTWADLPAGKVSDPLAADPTTGRVVSRAANWRQRLLQQLSPSPWSSSRSDPLAGGAGGRGTSAFAGAGDDNPLDGGQSDDGGWWSKAAGWLQDNPWALQLGGDILSAGLDQYNAGRDQKESSERFRQSLAQRQREFDRTQRLRDAQAAVGAETRLSRAPLADRAQAMILARLGATPGTFRPRDVTRGGTAAFNAESTSPYANTIAALERAGRTYTPGAGGVRTAALERLLRQMMTPDDAVGTT